MPIKKSAIFYFLLRFQTQEGTGKHLEDLQVCAEKEIRHFELPRFQAKKGTGKLVRTCKHVLKKKSAIFNFLFRFQTQEGTGKHLEDLQARAEKEIRYSITTVEICEDNHRLVFEN